MTPRRLVILIVVLLIAAATVAVVRFFPSLLPFSKGGKTMNTTTLTSPENKKEIYFAGGCFWGTEKYFAQIPGVLDVTSGYAQGHVTSAPTYEQVCSGTTGCRETVRVTYDRSQISLDALMLAFFKIIDPTLSNQQGNDVGSQYQTGVYYSDDADAERVSKIMNIERALHTPFAVESEKLTHFFEAEEYHQDYLDKNPFGYCHISPAEMRELTTVIERAQKRGDSVNDAIIEAFAPESYKVTQQSATERPFTSKYEKETRKGLYVDITTGEPLFLSDDKYQSSCGWPAFTKTITKDATANKTDTSYGMVRTEVRSTQGDAHLGHVFTGDPESPNGVRYCINGAALRFIPFENLDEEGYGDLKKLFK